MPGIESAASSWAMSVRCNPNFLRYTGVLVVHPSNLRFTDIIFILVSIPNFYGIPV